MKRFRILSALLAVLTVFGVFGSFAVVETGAADVSAEPVALTQAAQNKLNSMELALTGENGEYQLYLDSSTGEIALYNTKTHEALFSNPLNEAQYDSTTRVTNQFLSQIIVNYTTIWNNYSASLYSYPDATAKDQMIVKKIKNGVRVEYTLGTETVKYILPSLITADRMESLILAYLDEDSAEYKNITRRYKLYDTTGMDTTSQKYQAIIAACPRAAVEPTYMLNTSVGLTSRYAREIAQVLEAQTAYTYEEYEFDMEEHGTKEETAANPLFKVAIEYRLDDQGLLATVSGNSITYDEENYSLDGIEILPYLGAATTSIDDGYAFLPDGSGTLIRFDDIRQYGRPYGLGADLYGIDYAAHDLMSQQLQNREAFRLPVFGLTREEHLTDEEGNTSTVSSGFLGIIVSGDGVGSISANVDPTNYSYAYSEMKPVSSDTYTLDETSDTAINIRSERRFTGEFTVRYIMLHDADAASAAGVKSNYATSYVGMANAYRDYLLAEGALSPLSVSGDIPLYIEAFGSMPFEKQILSFPVEVDLPLTTFDNVLDMYKDLNNEEDDIKDISNVNFILTGFSNEGLIRQKYPTTLKWISALGGTSGVKELLENAESFGFNVYPNFDFAYSSNRSSGGLNYKYHAARTIDGRYANKREYDPATQSFARTGFAVVISASCYDVLYDKFLKNYTKYDFENIAVMTLGTALSSDYDEDEPYNREDNKEFTQRILERMAEDYNVIVEGGNAYSIKYASTILNLPTDSSLFLHASESVPFAGMVLHGYKNLTGESINFAGDTDYTIMKAIENGVSAYFQLSYQSDNVHEMKDYLLLAQYYAVDFVNWFSDLTDIYHELNNNMKALQTVQITDHEFLVGERIPTAEELEAGVDRSTVVDNGRIVRVEYGNNTSFILNYNYDFDVAVEYEGMTISLPALGYVKIVANNSGYEISNYGNDTEVTVTYNGTVYTVPVDGVVTVR